MISSTPSPIVGKTPTLASWWISDYPERSPVLADANPMKETSDNLRSHPRDNPGIRNFAQVSWVRNFLGQFQLNNYKTQINKVQVENTMCIKKPRDFLVFVMRNVLTILYSRRSQCDDFTCTRLLIPSMWCL